MKKLITVCILLTAILSVQCQEPDLEGYSIEAWEANNAAWQLKYDSVAALNDQNCDSLNSLIDSLEIASQGWYDAFRRFSDTTIKVGDHYFEVHDTVSGNWSKITTKGDEVWLTYYADSLRYHFWVIDREPGNKYFEFWIGKGNGAGQVMRMDTSRFNVNYQNLHEYFK